MTSNQKYQMERAKEMKSRIKDTGDTTYLDYVAPVKRWFAQHKRLQLI